MYPRVHPLHTPTSNGLTRTHFLGKNRVLSTLALRVRLVRRVRSRTQLSSHQHKGMIMLKAIGAFFVCMWVADFATGFFHWLEDTYCLEHLPLVGGFICEPNIQHHIDPTDIVRNGTFFSRNILQWATCGILFLLLCPFGLGNIYTFMTLLFASFGNEVHRWNHSSKSGPIVSLLKETGLVQMQRQHSLHHKPPYCQYYCTLTSQLNPVLERLNFWRRLERAIEVTTGLTPKRENRRDAAPPKKPSTPFKQAA